MRQIGVLLAVVMTAVSAASAAEKNPFNVDVQFGWQGCVRPMEWTPVEIGIQASLDEHFDGLLTVSNLQGSGAAMAISHRFVLTRGEPYYRPVVTKFAFGAPECRVAILDGQGRRVCWENAYSLWDFQKSRQSITVVTGADLLVGIAGRNTFGLSHLSKGTHSRGMTASHFRQAAAQAEDQAEEARPSGHVYVKEKLLRYLPWDWTAYASLDLLVLYDLDWSALKPEQSQAIVDWVSSGGKVLMILGTHPLPAQHPLARVMPYRLGPARRLRLAADVLGAWGCANTDSDTVSCWPLEGGGDPRWQPVSFGTDQQVAAVGPCGFGQVGIVAFDPSVLGGRQQENLSRFWVDRMTPLLDRRTIEIGPLDEKDENYYAYEADETSSGTGAVIDFILDIPQMQPISIGWVILLLVGLAVVIGPVDYLVLKRYDRLPLTWLTFAAYIGFFSVCAYYGVAALRSGPAQVRAVTVTDAVQGRPGAWSCCYSGIFASVSDAYRLDGLSPRDWWSAVSPQASDYLYAYQQQGGFKRRFVCIQEDGGNLPVDVPISIWSMQCMMTEGPVDDVPLRADIAIDGDRLQGRVENRSDRPVARGHIYLGNGRGLAFGPIAPGESLPLDGRLIPVKQWNAYMADSPPMRYGYPGEPDRVFDPGAAYFAGGIYHRTRAIGAYLTRGDAVVCAEYDGAPVAYRLAKHRNEVVSKSFVRLVVTPRIEGATDGPG